MTISVNQNVGSAPSMSQKMDTLMAETTTPTAVIGKGQLYTKADNKLYFQDGAGVEHEVAFV